ncbi:hypothetical protein Tco_1282063 [Tanacetum coccineum]
MGVRVNFTSQSTTAALSIENGSLFEGESEFEKLKIYLITLVSIRSDWEDLPWLFRSVENLNMMAEQNVPAQAPTRTDEQIVPRSQWLQIGKINLLFDAQKIQKNPIFQISVDILRNTNFFRAFSASASVPAIYIQHADRFTKALDITPVDPAHPFELPPTSDTVIDFVNQLGYPEPVEFVYELSGGEHFPKEKKGNNIWRKRGATHLGWKIGCEGRRKTGTRGKRGEKHWVVIGGWKGDWGKEIRGLRGGLGVMGKERDGGNGVGD